MAIRLKHWLSEFCAWHEQYRRRMLPTELLAPYTEARDDLCATLVVAQRLELQATGVRRALRVARALPVVFEGGTAKISAITQDISASGVSALVGHAPPVGTRLTFRLSLGREVPLVVGRCRVVAASPLPGSVRMAVTFEDLHDEEQQHVEDVVLDAICAEMRALLLARNGQSDNPAFPPPSVGKDVG